ncbi:MAG TPA: hypothetical protein PLE45_05205 [Spirochaetota bacterium]|nr:hypothetical protein [Spirochaetota bacterium]HPP04170.1 hypothetical protein [Spirochaetota bacterium]
MLINLNDLFKPDFIQRLNNLRIKIVSVKEKSTVILIKGHKVEIPYVLDKNKIYLLSYDKENKNLKIIEKKSDNIIKIKDNILNSFFDNLINLNELDNLDVENYLNYLNSDIQKVEEKNKRKPNDFILKNNRNEFFFIFQILFCNIPASLFLKISEKKIVSLFLYLKKRLKNKEKILNDMRENLNHINFDSIVIFDDDRDEYLNKIFTILDNNRIDIII